MAGIGFRLQKLLNEDSYTGLIKGYLFSAIISSGPMLTSIICIALLGLVSMPILTAEDYLLFRATIVYVFAFSLIFTGLFQMLATRYIADRLYMKEPSSLIPCFMGLLVITFICQSILGSLFFYHVLPDWRYVFVSTSLYIIISSLWNTMIFISATKNYMLIVGGFAAGSLISFVCGYYLGLKIGMIGYLLGFCIGQFIIVIVLAGSLLREFNFYKNIDFNFILYFRKYPELCITGLVINLSVWIDKFLFWFSGYGFTIKGMIHIFPLYDSAFFLGYLSIVPTLSIFVMKVETEFYRKYRNFYQMITGKASLDAIEEAKTQMVQNLKESTATVLKVQGFVTLMLLIGAVNVVHFTKLTWAQLVIFKISILSALLLIFFQLLLIIMLYFEFRKETLLLTLLFLVLNVAATYASIELGFRSFGYGFFTASFLSLTVGYFVLNYKINNLEFLTFASQPVHKVEI
ncbi:exopolysaccharide Pel transporter PelG [bacterium]|nr:exopolysaccharide Pel transporter PelG [bacterium]